METRGKLKKNTFDEGIDLTKLWLTIRHNLVWILLIFLLVNLFTYLYFIRYTPNLYQSQSEIKLDIKNEASSLGIKTIVEDQNLNVMSGEIELIQSKLFLRRVLDSVKLDISYFNKGEILNYEFFGNEPYSVSYEIHNSSFYNIPIFVDQIGPNEIRIRVSQTGTEVTGQYEREISLPGVNLVIHKNKDFNWTSDLDCFFIINSPDVLMNYLNSNITVEPLNFNANTIQITFKDYNALKAQTIVNKVDSLYLQFSNEQKNLANRQKINWLSNELQQIEGKMGQYETYFEDFIIKNKTNDLDEELKNTITIINGIDSQRFELSRRIGEVNQLMDEMNTGTFYTSAIQRQSLPPVINDNLEKLNDLQLKFDNLKLSYTEVTFAFREREHEINTLRNQLVAQLNDLKNSWLKKLQQLNQQKSKLENDFALMPNRNTEFNKNQRFYKLYEEFYLMLMQSKSEFEIAQAGTTPDFKILSPASLNYTPIAPNKLMILGIGLVASFVINFFFIGILYLINNKITSVHELEHFDDVPVLGVVPASSYLNGSVMHVMNHPKSMVSEAFRTLRTNLDFFSPSAKQKTIAISSTVSGEGKSFIAMNLGGVMALSKKKVVLLDLDMRKPKANLPAPFNDNSKGVSTILIRKNKWEDCIVKTPVEHLDYIASGPHPPNPSELLLNGAFEELLTELKTNYDYIIMDTPPVGLVTDGIMAMKRADISIYIFRANYSKREFLSNLQRIININKFTNITTLFNALPVSERKSYGYGYYEDNRKGGLKNFFKK
ncbi:MAG TPA: polysaccharide biosynthesis tyrosine autokinase [Cyclobacteriaceae bacterium]|nr:polysaccharide biosynthesis tyrosine autokinase [Cyclobacteriaceae bacterium]